MLSRTARIKKMARNGVAFTTHFPANQTALQNTSHTGRHFKFTYDDLYNCLYRHNEPQLIDIEAFKAQRKSSTSDGERPKEVTKCEACRSKQGECPVHKIPNSNRKLVIPGQKQPVKFSYAIASFPEEVQLCVSSIPGAGCGVCAKQHIPVGTWIGPYEGKQVKCDDVKPNTDTSYMWEIYQDGKLSHYLDASDENTSSWMRFIRCARYREEQNLFSFQYCGNIYYRAFREISVGAELLVWYDEKYPQDMGIPLEVQDMALVDPNGTRLLQEVLAAQGQTQPTDRPINTSPYPAPVSCQPAVTSNTPTKTSPRKSPLPVSRDNVNIKEKPSPTSPNDTRVSWHHKVPIPVTSHSTIPTGEAFTQVERTRDMTPVVLKEERVVVEDCDDDRRFSLADGSELSLMKCGQCNQSFAQKNMLQVHVCPRMPRRPYTCNYCSESFSQPNEVRTHVVTHANDKPFKCGYCSRTFAGATTLNNHIRTHTGERPFLCEKCGKSFTQASQLSKHQRIPHECTF